MTGERSGEASGRGSRLDAGLLGVVAVAYATLAVIDPGEAKAALASSGAILGRIAPVLGIVWVAIALTHLLLERESIAATVESAHGPVGYLVATLAGTLSHGPVYAWYAFLADLRDRGLSDGLIAVFLYNRAIKLPLLPAFLAYFEWRFALVLFATMIAASLVQGVVIETVSSTATNR
ncbi:MAG: hypothetical protein ABEI98_06530 [Halorhabdus sp.]